MLINPNIIAYETSFMENDVLHIVMEFAEGIEFLLPDLMSGGDLSADISKTKQAATIYPEKVYQ